MMSQTLWVEKIVETELFEKEIVYKKHNTDLKEK